MTFFERAMIVAVLVGALSGLVGTFVVLRKRVMFAQALTHATFPGAVVAALIGVNIQVGAVVACVLAIITLTVIDRMGRRGVQAATGVILAGGFAAGILIKALNPQAPMQVDSFLFGSILSSTAGDAILVSSALVVTVVLILAAGKHLLFSIFDPDGYRGAGYDPGLMDALLLVLTTLTVVTAMPAVGAVLAIALIAAPAAAARQVTHSVVGMLWLAPVLGVASSVMGMFASDVFDISAGASIALVATAIFGVCFGIGRMRERRARFRRKAPAATLDTGLIRVQKVS